MQMQPSVQTTWHGPLRPLHPLALMTKFTVPGPHAMATSAVASPSTSVVAGAGLSALEDVAGACRGALA